VEVAGSKGRIKGGKEKARGPRREGKNQEGTMSRNEKEKEKERSEEKRGGEGTKDHPPLTAVVLLQCVGHMIILCRCLTLRP